MEEFCVFDKLIDNFEEAAEDLKAWYDYYKDEEILKSAKKFEEDKFTKNFGKVIDSIMLDVPMLRAASTGIKLNELAKHIQLPG